MVLSCSGADDAPELDDDDAPRLNECHGECVTLLRLVNRLPALSPGASSRACNASKWACPRSWTRKRSGHGTRDTASSLMSVMRTPAYSHSVNAASEAMSASLPFFNASAGAGAKRTMSSCAPLTPPTTPGSTSPP